MNQQTFTFAKQFTDNAFKAQAALLKGMEQAAAVQLKALEQHAQATSDFATESFEIRDAEGVRVLWEKGVAFNRDGAERGVSVAQELMGVAQKTAETLGGIAAEQQQAGETAARTAKKAAR